MPGFIDGHAAVNIGRDEERVAGDGAMSDNWVGPGWWMASDGKWYPPRTPAPLGASSEGDLSAETRWSRRTPDGEPIPGARPLTPSEVRAERVATDSEQIARPSRRARVELVDSIEPVSVRRIDLSESADVDLSESVENGKEIDLKESLDLRQITDVRDSVEPESEPVPEPVVGESEVLCEETVRPTHAGSRARPKLTFAETVESPVGEIEREPSRPGGFGDVGRDDVDELDEESLADLPDPTPQEDEPLQHAVLPAVVEREEPRSRKGLVLLALATGLAVLCGVLGALLLRERSDADDLRAELVEALAGETLDEPEVGLDELNDEIRTLRLQNEQLEAQRNDLSALVLELPEGRVTEIVIPFTPVLADEENGRLIAMSSLGEYVVWGEGADGPITDSGQLSGSPTGLFAAQRKAWISTDLGRIDVISLAANEDGLPSVEFGPSDFLAAEQRGYWTYDRAGGDLVRLRKSDGGITAAVPIPVRVIDLTIGAGSVWALGDDSRVYRVNTADFTVQAIDAGADLISITAGPDALWTLSAADGSLRRVDAVSGEVLVTVPVGRDPIDATFAESSVWVALRSGTSLIEVDTRTSAVISRTALPSTPTALHQGDSGVFVTMEGDVPLVRVASLTPPLADDEAVEDVDAG